MFGAGTFRILKNPVNLSRPNWRASCPGPRLRICSIAIVWMLTLFVIQNLGITKFPDDDRFKVYKVYKKMSMKSLLTKLFAT